VGVFCQLLTFAGYHLHHDHYPGRIRGKRNILPMPGVGVAPAPGTKGAFLSRRPRVFEPAARPPRFKRAQQASWRRDPGARRLPVLPSAHGCAGISVRADVTGSSRDWAQPARLPSSMPSKIFPTRSMAKSRDTITSSLAAIHAPAESRIVPRDSKDQRSRLGSSVRVYQRISCSMPRCPE
jgi:hypothetical protein